MGIFILILKIIGILLAVCILLLGAVLAVPVRYRIGAEIQQKRVTGNAVFFWFFHILDFRFCYGKDGIICKLRIFGFLVGRKKDRKRKRKERKKKTKGTPKKSPKRAKTGKNSGISDIGEGSGESWNDTKELSEKEGRNNISPNGKTRKDQSKAKAGRGRKKPLRRIRRFFRDLKKRISDITAKGQTLKEKIHNIKKLILDETNRSAFVRIWKELRYLIRHYSPRKASGEIAFGMEDPSQTGQILGAVSVFPFWARYTISIYPDFQTETFFVEGRIKMKGHIRIWHILVSGVRLIKDKDVKLLLERIRT